MLATTHHSTSLKNIYIEVVIYAHVLLFLYAGIYKLLDYRFFAEQLRLSPIIGIWNNLFAWLVPATEIVIVLLLLWHRTKTIGLYAATGLMFLFTAYIFFLLNFSPMVPCSCGGILSTMGWKEHLYMNAGFVLAGVVAICLGRKQTI